MYRNRGVLILGLVALLAASPACNNDGRSGFVGSAFEEPIEPACIAVREVEEPNEVGRNDDPTGTEEGDVIQLVFGQAGYGSVRGARPVVDGAAPAALSVITDTDFWRIDLVEGQIIRVELFGTRLNQGGDSDDRPEATSYGWDQTPLDGYTNVPRLTLWRDVGLGIVKLNEHTFANRTIPDSSYGWTWGGHDPDFPGVRIPETGTYYLSVTPEFEGPGADYAVCVRQLPMVPTQFEAEQPPDDDPSNDGTEIAELLSPVDGALLVGRHTSAGDQDYYRLDFTSPDPVIVCASVLAYRNGVFMDAGAYYPPRLKLLDPDGGALNGTGNEDGNQTGRIFFDDPAFCFKAYPGRFEDEGNPIGPDNPMSYFLRVDTPRPENDRWSDAAAEYFLSVELRPLSEAVQESEPNGFDEEPETEAELLALADPVAYGDLIAGNIGGPVDADIPDGYDFFTFQGTAGDAVTLTVFDEGNDATANECVGVILFSVDDEDEFVPIFADPSPDTTLKIVCGDRLQAIRAILQETDTYYVAVTNAYGETDYCLDLELVSPAQYETEPNDDPLVDTPGSLDGFGRAAGIIRDPVAEPTVADCHDIADVDTFQFVAQENEVVTISIFAEQAERGWYSSGFNALAGHGSSLHPRLRILREVEIEGEPDLEELSHSTFTPTSGDITTESVARGLATMAVTFVAPEAGTYFVEVSDERQTGYLGECIGSVERLFYVIDRS